MFRKIVTATVPLIVLAAYVWFSMQPSAAFPPLATLGRALGPYGYSIVVNTIAIAAPILVVSAMRMSVSVALRDLGILANPVRPVLFGVVATAPAWIDFAMTAHPAHGLSLREFLLLCFYFPIAEEVMFRGFAFGQSYARAGWNFWAAALAPAILFALVHAVQAEDMTELAGISAITLLGSLVFSYFFLRFNFNIWAAFSLHAFLNTWFYVFTPNESALGGWSANIFRFGSIAFAFLIAWAAGRVPLLRALVPARALARQPAGGLA
jgi:membrane protease YdiL (CAAX protease family)